MNQYGTVLDIQFSELIKYLAIYIVTLLVSALAGGGILKYGFKKKSHSGWFWAEATGLGLLLGITLSALIVTSGKTIYWCVILLLFLLIINRKKTEPREKESIKSKDNSPGFLWFGVTSILISFFQFWYFVPITGDFIFYARLSDSVFRTGQENYLCLYDAFIPAGGVQLYHFGEIYLTGIISQISGAPSETVFIKVVLPIFQTLALIMTGSLLSRKWSAWVAFPVWFGLGQFFLQVISTEMGHHSWWFYGVPDIAGNKLLILYPVFLGVLRAYIDKNRILTVVYLSLSVILYITLLIPVTGGAGTYFVIFFILHRIFPQKLTAPYKEVLLIPVVSILMMLIIKIFASPQSSQPGLTEIFFPISTYLSQIKHLIYLFLQYITRPALLYPLVGLFMGVWIFRKNKLQQELHAAGYWLSGLVVTCGFIVIMSLQSAITDTTQALSNYLGPLMLATGTGFMLQLSFGRTKFIIIAILACTSILNIRSNLNFHVKGPDETVQTYMQFAREIKSAQPTIRWGYVSERYWSRWLFNTTILFSPLTVGGWELPIELGPVLDSEENFDIYCRRSHNLSYPPCKFNLTASGFSARMAYCMKALNLQFLFIENVEYRSDSLFYNNFRPVFPIDKLGNGLFELIE